MENLHDAIQKRLENNRKIIELRNENRNIESWIIEELIKNKMFDCFYVNWKRVTDIDSY